MLSTLLQTFAMANNYEQRKVAHYESKGIIVDTSAVSDSDFPYETGINSKKYYTREWVIVENYNSKEEASIGHNKWVKLMKSKNPPKKLKDVSGFVSKVKREMGI